MSTAPTPPPAPPPGTAAPQPAPAVVATPVTTPATKKVRRAARHKSNALPRRDPKCKICNHPEADKIFQEKVAGATNTDLIKKYFPGQNARTRANSFTTHWDNHLNLKTSIAVLQTVVPAGPDGSIPIAVSTQRIFNQAAKEHIDAQQVLEKMLVSLMERFNVLEDEFLSHHLAGKCDVCQRGPEQVGNLTKLLNVVKEIRETNGEWMKLRNPKAVMKHFFDGTFLRFFETMMSLMQLSLQEKGQLTRQAVTEYSEGKISHQLLLRRIAEVEDMGAGALAERGIRELRAIQEYIDNDFKSGRWAQASS